MAVEALANPERVKQSVTLTPGGVEGLLPRRRPAQPGEICRLADNADELASLQILYTLMVRRLRVAWCRRPPATPPGGAAEPLVVKATHAKASAARPRRRRRTTVSLEFGALARGRKVTDDTKRDRHAQGRAVPGQRARR